MAASHMRVPLSSSCHLCVAGTGPGEQLLRACKLSAAAAAQLSLMRPSSAPWTRLCKQATNQNHASPGMPFDAHCIQRMYMAPYALYSWCKCVAIPPYALWGALTQWSRVQAEAHPAAETGRSPKRRRLEGHGVTAAAAAALPDVPLVDLTDSPQPRSLPHSEAQPAVAAAAAPAPGCAADAAVATTLACAIAPMVPPLSPSGARECATLRRPSCIAVSVINPCGNMGVVDLR